MVRPACLYCGKPLPAELVAKAAKTASEAVRALDAPAAGADAAVPERTLLILDLRERLADARELARVLGVSAFEAEQRARRGGYQLLRLTAPAEASAQAALIAAAGVPVRSLSEADLKSPPLEVIGGRLEPGRLNGRAHDARFEWGCDDLLIVVRGPIQRQLTASVAGLKRIKTATPSEGYRLHLHRVSDPRPLEIDPDAFEFSGDAGAASSSMLRLQAWLEGFEPKPLVDDGFRLLPPALAPAVVNDATARALGRAPEDKKNNPLLDNLAQFRFYSAWRAAIERGR